MDRTQSALALVGGVCLLSSIALASNTGDSTHAFAARPAPQQHPARSTTCSQSQVRPAMATGKRAAVVGAGAAGLAAAKQLRQVSLSLACLLFLEWPESMDITLPGLPSLVSNLHVTLQVSARSPHSCDPLSHAHIPWTQYIVSFKHTRT